jgi:methionyl aminopeptidase
MRKFRGVFLKNDNEIALMREANHIVYLILQAMAAEIRPGASSMRFEEIAQDLCRKYNVRPSFQGYRGFPYALCCSINEEVVHGFPSAGRKLQEGDLVSLDMGVVLEGFHGDAARTFPAGEVSARAAELLRRTAEALEDGCAAARPGNNLRDISAAVQKKAEAHNFGLIKRFVGHGVGSRLHEKPEIPNFVSEATPDLPLLPGMVLAIEPMFSLGSGEVDILSDEWTAVTRDRSLAAHFEHSVAITAHGPLILDC